MNNRAEKIRHAVDRSGVDTMNAIRTCTGMINRDGPGSYAIGIASMVASTAWTMGLMMKLATDAGVTPDVEALFGELVDDMRSSVIKAATAKLEGRI